MCTFSPFTRIARFQPHAAASSSPPMRSFTSLTAAHWPAAAPGSAFPGLLHPSRWCRPRQTSGTAPTLPPHLPCRSSRSRRAACWRLFGSISEGGLVRQVQRVAPPERSIRPDIFTLRRRHGRLAYRSPGAAEPCSCDVHDIVRVRTLRCGGPPGWCALTAAARASRAVAPGRWDPGKWRNPPCPAAAPCADRV